jgi:hypothetical protein
MAHIVLHVLIAGLGGIWMVIRHPVKIERERILAEKYKGSYEVAGKRVLMVLIALVFVMELLVEFLPK